MNFVRCISFLYVREAEKKSTPETMAVMAVMAVMMMMMKTEIFFFVTNLSIKLRN